MTARGLDCSAVPRVPDVVRSSSPTRVAEQPIPWNASTWQSVFRGHDDLLVELGAHAKACNGLTRDFIHGLADRDPMDLFLGAMAWGWGTVPIGPRRVEKILEQPDARLNIGEIVKTVRAEGAVSGWDALLMPEKHKIPYLGMAYGTKLLYFAAYRLDQSPRPLILDARVRRSLVEIYKNNRSEEIVPPPGRTIWRQHYGRYVIAAECWAEALGHEESDAIEYALFNPNGGRPDLQAESDDGDAMTA